MDFKAAGTRKGIALQMDTAIGGLTREILEQGDANRPSAAHFLRQDGCGAGRTGRKEGRSDAPRIETIMIPTDKNATWTPNRRRRHHSWHRRANRREDRCGRHGQGQHCLVGCGRSARRWRLLAISQRSQSLARSTWARSWFEARRIRRAVPGTDGLLHISEIAEHRVKEVKDELREGDQALVKVRPRRRQLDQAQPQGVDQGAEGEARVHQPWRRRIV